MKLNILLPLFLVLSLGSAASYCPSTPVNETAQKAIFFEFVTKFYIKKDAKGAFTDHVDVNYTQHNPYALSGRDNAITFLTALMPSVNISIMHAAFYNSTGWVHFRQDQTGALPAAGVDVLHMNGSCIVEHWDVIQERPANATNPLAMWSP
ncbi:uncharacterized protein PAC_08170 [Phialocephala subalpina]|uniref:SnoaL-like domain-containing protein n=1 Tax=Phialocephala subalpina TaxID=576137 RepID=A0A1L7WZT0_9HELO|nr:uncharacterized protein PAC_08170 [Phialocephala subalpina]